MPPVVDDVIPDDQVIFAKPDSHIPKVTTHLANHFHAILSVTHIHAYLFEIWV